MSVKSSGKYSKRDKTHITVIDNSAPNGISPVNIDKAKLPQHLRGRNSITTINSNRRRKLQFEKDSSRASPSYPKGKALIPVASFPNDDNQVQETTQLATIDLASREGQGQNRLVLSMSNSPIIKGLPSRKYSKVVGAKPGGIPKLNLKLITTWY